MILSLVSDPFLRTTVRKAALPDEDVFWRPDDVREAVRLGFPRLAVTCAPSVGDPGGRGARGVREGGGVTGARGATGVVADDPGGMIGHDLPLLVLTSATLDRWKASYRSVGFAVRRVDDHGLRLRTLMKETAGPPGWIDEVFRDLGRTAGRGVPPALRGFGRRILEFPARYSDLRAVADLSGITRGALKARFRRRELPSPAVYLRWFRILAAQHVLSRPGTTTEQAAFRVGLHSSGNFCRFVQEVTGLSPTEIRDPAGRVRLLGRFVDEGLGRSEMERWDDLAELFLRGVA